jgi:transcriptional regulator with XRE-family HTH domain
MKVDNRIDIASNLAKAINDALLKKFGKVPSASIFANQFNLRAYGTKTITRETARKWMLGLALPEMDKLPALVEWLDIDVSKLFKYKTDISNNHNGSSHLNHKNEKNVDYYLLKSLSGLTDHSKNTLYIVAWMLMQHETNNHNIEVCEELIRELSRKSSKYKLNNVNQDL